MTTATASVAVSVQATPGTRLEALLAQYELAKAEAEKAAETLKAITDGIKAELAHNHPGVADVRVDSPDLGRPLRMHAVESWRIDAKRLKAEDPETYVRYAKKSTSWRLEMVRS